VCGLFDSLAVPYIEGGERASGEDAIADGLFQQGCCNRKCASYLLSQFRLLNRQTTVGWLLFRNDVAMPRELPSSGNRYP
jgi:hypothetical protein